MSEMISVAEGFQYSVNIAYDLHADDKLKSYIPTQSALQLMEDILQSTLPTSTDRSRVLIGAYGKGKSHIEARSAPLWKADAGSPETWQAESACPELLWEQQQVAARYHYWQQHKPHAGFPSGTSADVKGKWSAGHHAGNEL